MRKIIAATAVAALVAAATHSALASVWTVTLPGLVDREAPCPGSSTLPNTTVLQRFRDDVVKLDVLVVTDPADLADAKKAMKAAAVAYEPYDIRLVPTFEAILVPEVEDDENMLYLDWLKDRFGSSRPPGADVVYLALNRPVSAAGRADCIGGIAGDATAFAVGTLQWDHIVGVDIVGYDEPGIPVADGGGKIAAHEIGHLLGAEHEDSLCGPGMRTSEPARPCEVMLTLSPHNLGLHFGPLNGAVVRRYALSYARP